MQTLPKEDGLETRHLGLAISPGLAFGHAYVHEDILNCSQFQYAVDDDHLDEEWNRIQQAIAQVLNDLATSRQRVAKELGQEMAAIFDTHQLMLHDPALEADMMGELHQRRVNAEEVVKSVLAGFEQQIRANESGMLSERGDDVADLSRRLLRVLTGTPEHSIKRCPPGAVFVARQLFPSKCIYLKQIGVRAVVIERGGSTSHAALMTREMGIPAVSGIVDITSLVSTGDHLLIDGNNGTVIANASKSTTSRFLSDVESCQKAHQQHQLHCCEPAVTVDGQSIQVLANVGCRTDIEQAAKCGADGIGLYRIEHHFLARQTLPTEEELLDELGSALAAAGDLEVTVRLLDTGGDKRIPWIDLPHEPDPFLGRRGIRFLLAWPDLLRTQLTVLLKQSLQTRLSILVPMVTQAEEMRLVREEMCSVATELGIEIPPLGAMIETPAAALCIAQIAEHCDFCSIGSNDLTQYTMVAGRENPLVADYFDDQHPAVLRLIRIAAKESGGMPLAVCGELASSGTALQKLLDAGIRTLSVAPPLIPEVKSRCRAARVDQREDALLQIR